MRGGGNPRNIWFRSRCGWASLHLPPPPPLRPALRVVMTTTMRMTVASGQAGGQDGNQFWELRMLWSRWTRKSSLVWSATGSAKCLPVFACPRRRELQFWTWGMTKKVQSGQAGVSLFLSRYLAIVEEAGVQIGQTTKCVCPLCCEYVCEWAATIVCVLVLVSSC